LRIRVVAFVGGRAGRRVIHDKVMSS
jgi:hypothetical protein